MAVISEEERALWEALWVDISGTPPRLDPNTDLPAAQLADFFRGLVTNPVPDWVQERLAWDCRWNGHIVTHRSTDPADYWGTLIYLPVGRKRRFL